MPLLVRLVDRGIGGNLGKVSLASNGEPMNIDRTRSSRRTFVSATVTCLFAFAMHAISTQSQTRSPHMSATSIRINPNIKTLVNVLTATPERTSPNCSSCWKRARSLS